MKLKTFMFILLFALVAPVKLLADVPADQVAQLYVATFNRAPDAGGLNFWANTSGLTIEGIAKEFFKAPETQRKYPEGTTDEEFVNTIYQNVFGRDAEQAGLDYWVDVLGKGWSTRDEMIMTVIGGAQNKDLQVLLNKTAVGMYYVDEVGENHVDGNKFSLENITDDVATVINEKQAIDVIASGHLADLEDDIEYYLAMVTSAGDLSPVMDEISALLGAILSGDTSVVTITPALETIDLSNLPPNINIAANFGNGYTPENTTAVYTGSALIDITGIAFAQTDIGANLSLAATNVQRDGEPVLNGLMTGSLNVGMAGNTSITANLNFSNLASMVELLNGGIAVNIPALSAEMQLLQPATLTLTQFSTLDYQMNGTVTMTQLAPDTFDTNFNITTNQGPVSGVLQAQVNIANPDQIILSTPSGGPLSVETATLVINQVTMDISEDSTCTDLPVSGNIVVTKGVETSTINFSNCTYTVN